MTWHPILAAEEIEPGSWRMIDSTGKCYGLIRLLTIEGSSAYRAVTWAERSEDRRLIGYFLTLKEATFAAHQRLISETGPSGFAPRPW